MRSARHVWVVTIAVSIFLLCTSCAREESREQRLRDTSNREYNRFSRASGRYSGYLVSSDTSITPLSLDVKVNKNPTNQGMKPNLVVGMRIGLFGGITIGSTSGDYDWGVHELTASFGRKRKDVAGSSQGGETAAKLELRAYLKGDTLERATLTGPHIGQREVVLRKNGPDLFDESFSQQMFAVKWTSAGGRDLRALLKLVAKFTTQDAPDSSDMPYLPSLDASVVFDSFAATPEQAQSVLYDPLAGTLALKFSDTSWMLATNMALGRSDQQETTPRGSLSLGGVDIRSFELRPLSTAPDLTDLPPRTFLVTYKGGPESLTYKAVAYLNYLGRSGSNKLNLPFLTFPEMRIELDVCTGNDVLNQSVLTLKSVDFLKREAVFHRSGSDQDPLKLKFATDWNEVNGEFLQTDTHEGGGKPKIFMWPNTDVLEKGCAAEDDSDD